MIMDLEDTFGWIGCFLSTCFFLVELIPFINIIRGKVYFEDSPGFFMSASYANCFLWMIYGDLVFSETIKTTNMIACLICFVAMIIYLIYERKKFLLDSILNFLIIFMASWAVFKYLSIEVDDDRVVGKLCFCSSCIIYIYFYYIIYRVVKEKNYMLIGFNHITIYFVNSMIWIFYGIVTNDFYVILPNSMGTFLSLIQVIIYIKYESKYPLLSGNDFTDVKNNEDNKKEENVDKEDKKDKEDKEEKDHKDDKDDKDDIDDKEDNDIKNEDEDSSMNVGKVVKINNKIEN